MKTIHIDDVHGHLNCVVQMRQYNKKSCAAAARYISELEASGYKLTNQYGGDVVWNFIYTKINRGKENE